VGYIAGVYGQWAVARLQGNGHYTHAIYQTPFVLAPHEDEQVMLETCRGPRFSINLMKSASRWFHYTDYYSLFVVKFVGLNKVYSIYMHGIWIKLDDQFLSLSLQTSCIAKNGMLTA
jgi:hypothetical protein